jgi:uncharacterized protein
MESTMTPEERDLVTELFDRLAALEDAQRDPEAERLIKDGLRQAPNAPYALVQTVLVQDEALKRADARIRELEEAAGGGGAAPQETSFLGSMRDALLGRREPHGSVPSVRPGEGAAEMSPAWRTGAQAMPAEPGAPIGQGGSFLGTAAATAAGIVGGSLLLSGIRSMMGGHGGFGGVGPAAASGSSPWSGGSAAGGELSREAGLDEIGRGRSAADDRGASKGQGLFDNSADDAEQDDGEQDQDSDDFNDDSDFDTDDGGGEE